MLTITKRFRWTMGHHLTHGYPGKCKFIHGHDYFCEVEIYNKAFPDKYGMVFDFGDVKKLKEWVDEHWDHGCLVEAYDRKLRDFLTENQMKHYLFPSNTTVENITLHLKVVFDVMLGQMAKDRKLPVGSLGVRHLRVYETPDSWADWYYEEEGKEDENQ